MRNYDPFVLPFMLGFLFLVVLIIYKFAQWLIRLNMREKVLFRHGMLSRKFLHAGNEVFMESLIHRKMFKANPLLGYMHMSLAFGWFLLIVLGNVESRLHTGAHLNMPYFPIFLKFFVTEKENIPFYGGFTNLMDFLLLMVLSGVFLALIKRMTSRIFGMRRTTNLKVGDKIALITLWLIFPLRLFAESLTAAQHHNGGFMTENVGQFLAAFLPTDQLSYPAWWLYSISLGAFFVAVPFSRYMHIPAEILLIYLRHFGIHSTKVYSSFSELEVYSCSRCGVCIDKCQLHTADIHFNTPTYFFRAIRERSLSGDLTDACLLCDRCTAACPVEINTTAIRIAKRATFSTSFKSDFSYLPANHTRRKADVAYFAGCMTHLTPAIRKAMIAILEHAKVKYHFIDEQGICCGRPLMMTGRLEEAQQLVRKNEALIKGSGARILLLSCPICLKAFREDYHLDIRIMHHSEYICELMDRQILQIPAGTQLFSFHDPCELGRGSGIFDQPRKILSEAGKLVKSKFEKENSFCCGGSLGHTSLSQAQRNIITQEVVNELTKNNPDSLVTACPLCKKTFTRWSEVPVKDIAEIVAEVISLGSTQSDREQNTNSLGIKVHEKQKRK